VIKARKDLVDSSRNRALLRHESFEKILKAFCFKYFYSQIHEAKGREPERPPDQPHLKVGCLDMDNPPLSNLSKKLMFDSYEILLSNIS
jgi:hypothetical protein